MTQRAADALVRTLEMHGVRRIYCVPGESYLTLLDALHDSKSIATIACRHESGAGFMALAEAKLTGRPGVYMVSRGPGSTNGSIALHVAQQDATPLICLIGQVARDERGRGAFQEIDYGQFFGGIAKAVHEVHDGRRLAETFARAWHHAASGTPGPVVISMPEDMLGDRCDSPPIPPLPAVRVMPDDAGVREAAQFVAAAERPLIIAGGALQRPGGREALAAAANRHGIPVALAWKHQDLFDNASPLYAGHLGFKVPKPYVDLLNEADLVLAIGTRLGDTASQGFTLPRGGDQRFVHVYPDAGPIGCNFVTDLGIVADAPAFLERLAGIDIGRPAARDAWIDRVGGYVKDMQRYEAPAVNDGVVFGSVVAAVARHAADDAVVITDAGNFSSWVHRHWSLKPSHRMIGAIGGAMGIAVPAAVACSLIEPGRQVIATLGDGGILMTGNELATAIQYGSRPKLFVSNNGSYGTIRLHQERDYPTRVIATDLRNPDLVAWASAFGARAFAIRSDAEIDDTVREALACDEPCVVDVHSSTEAISAFTTVTQLRARHRL